MVVVTSDLDLPPQEREVHGGRPVHAFARPDRYSALRSRSTLHTAFPGDGRDLHSGWAGRLALYMRARAAVEADVAVAHGPGSANLA
jgi:hypothetical protein